MYSIETRAKVGFWLTLGSARSKDAAASLASLLASELDRVMRVVRYRNGKFEVIYDNIGKEN